MWSKPCASVQSRHTWDPIDGAPEANTLVPSKSRRISSRLAFVAGTKAYEDQMNLLQRSVADRLFPLGAAAIWAFEAGMGGGKGGTANNFYPR